MPGLYEGFVLPLLTSWAMRSGELLVYRRRLASIASGYVLEVGIGSGLGGLSSANGPKNNKRRWKQRLMRSARLSISPIVTAESST